MTKAPKDLRIPIMMSSAEVEAIDDWRFANKVATRAEAVRRLCLVSLTIFENSDAILSSRAGLVDLLKMSMRVVDSEDTSDEDPHIFFTSLIEKTGDAAVELTNVARVLSTATQVVEIEEVLSNTKDLQQLASEAKKRIEENKAKRRRDKA